MRGAQSRRERAIAPRSRSRLVEKIKDEKLREAAHELFEELQTTATIENVYNNPATAARHAGRRGHGQRRPITMQELGEECSVRHGEEVLEGEISQLLLEQALKKAQA